MAQMPDQATVETLVQCLRDIDPALKYDVVKALNKLHVGHAGLKFKRDAIESILIWETRSYYEILHLLHAQQGFENRDGFALLKRALAEKQQQNLERIFRLLGLVYPARDIYNAYYGIISRQKTLRANSVEFLDNMLHRDIKKYLFPILDDLAPEVVLRKAEELFGVHRRTREESLICLINGDDNWLRACAAYCTIGIESETVADAVAGISRDPDPIVRETVELVLRRKNIRREDI
jgi:hypothetical protein